VLFNGQPVFLVAATTREAARAPRGWARSSMSTARPADRGRCAGGKQPSGTHAAHGPGRCAGRAASRAAPPCGPFRDGGQEHFYLEGQIAQAVPGEDGQVHILSSTQHPSEVQHLVAHLLGVPSADVTVEVRRLGGGFGGKETQATAPAAACAMVARLTGRPAADALRPRR
jgi:xanthine dehydrogenase large subunit